MASKSPTPSLPGAAIALTVAALTVANLVLAYLLAGAVGSRPLELPAAAFAGLIAVGGLAAVGAFLQWRAYLRKSREAHAQRTAGEARV